VLLIQGSILLRNSRRYFWQNINLVLLQEKILEDHGFDISIIGERRIWSISNHIRTEYKKYGEFHEGYRPRSVPAADASDDTGSKNNSDADKIKQLQQEVDYLKQEMEFLKKISSIRTTRK